jgi:hypothetical protein
MRFLDDFWGREHPNSIERRVDIDQLGDFRRIVFDGINVQFASFLYEGFIQLLPLALVARCPLFL